MCIILVKPAGVKLPAADILNTCWTSNPDGAGFAWRDKRGRVHWNKGHMHYNDLERALTATGKRYDLKAAPMLLHFRITTHGGTCQGNTHPFPICDSYDQMRETSGIAPAGVLAHNGIITIDTARGVSDTMTYTRQTIAPLTDAVPGWYDNPRLRGMIEAHTDGSRLAILPPGAGEVMLTGEWIEGGGGLLYSNYTYLAPRRRSVRRATVPISQIDGYIDLGIEWIDTADDGNRYGIDASGRVYEVYGSSAWRLPYAAALTYELAPVIYDDAAAMPYIVEEGGTPI